MFDHKYHTEPGPYVRLVLSSIEIWDMLATYNNKYQMIVELMEIIKRIYAHLLVPKLRRIKKIRRKF